MELRVLKYFITVAREESISAAADYLHMTQPTLSRQLKDLENELGKQLLIRGNRRITLTDDGMLLRRRAEEIVDLANKTEKEFLEQDNLVTGEIFIGGGETNAMHILARIIKEFKEEYPQIKFHLYSGNAQDVTEKLDKGLLDFGILIEPTNFSKYDFIKLPYTDCWGVLMKKDAFLASKEYINPQDLKDLPLICSNQDLVRNELSGWLKDDFDKLNIVATYNLIYNASLLVDEGSGYALTLDKLINTYNSTLCFKPLEPKLEVGLDLVWKKYQIFSKAADFFLKKVIELI